MLPSKWDIFFAISFTVGFRASQLFNSPNASSENAPTFTNKRLSYYDYFTRASKRSQITVIKTEETTNLCQSVTTLTQTCDTPDTTCSVPSERGDRAFAADSQQSSFKQPVCVGSAEPRAMHPHWAIGIPAPMLFSSQQTQSLPPQTGTPC